MGLLPQLQSLSWKYLVAERAIHFIPLDTCEDEKGRQKRDNIANKNNITF